jgi:threonine synthase
MEAEDPVISIPSGNFGDLMGGLISMKMGLPVHRFIAATNENDEFPKFMRTGIYEPIRPSKNCISNAMNVGHPSNLARLFALYGGQMDETGRVVRQPDINSMRKDIFAISVSDEETRRTIRDAYRQYRVLLEPHGAVGWSGLMKYLEEFGDWSPCISLETADPAKFPDEIFKLTGVNPSVPRVISQLANLDEHYQEIGTDYNSFKGYLKRRSSEEM